MDCSSKSLKYTLEELFLWKVSSLRDFCKKYGIATTNRTKNKLVALAFAVQEMNIQPSLTAKDTMRESEREYQTILQQELGGLVMRDPLRIPESEWSSEESSSALYPKLNVEDIQLFLDKHDASTYSQALAGEKKDMNTSHLNGLELPTFMSFLKKAINIA